MKKWILLMMLLLIIGQAQATFTAQDYLNGKTYLGSGNKLLDPLYLHIVDAQGADTVGKPFFFYIPGPAPAEIEGYLYYSATLDALVLRTATEWVTLEAGGDFASLDEAYNGGNAIDVDGSAVTLTVGLGDNNAGLLVAQNDSTNDPDAMNITSAADAGTAVGLQIDCTAGFDVQGTGDSWSISIAGLFDGEGLTGLTNNQSILFDGNNQIKFGDSDTEAVAMDFGTGNTLSWASGTGVDKFAFGSLDELSGIQHIDFDAATASIITQAGTGAADDLTIQQTAAAQDASLILQSSGTGTDALAIITSVADIDMDSADNITIDAADNITTTTAGGPIAFSATGGDFTVDSTDGSVILDGGEAVTDAINIDSAAGGLDVDVALSISLKSTENTVDSIEIVSTAGGIDITAAGAATEDIDIVNTAGSVNISAGENNAAAMVISTDGGTSAGLNIFADQGTGVSATTEHDASVQLHSDDGGIGLYTTANLGDAIRIETNGGVDENIFVQAIQGTGADSITLTSTVGGIAVTANAAGKDVVVSSVLGSINLKAEEDAADAILLEVDGVNSTTLRLLATTGTSVAEDGAAIQLSAIVGGISIQSDANLDDAVVIRADGGTSAEITIHNDQGNTTDSIDVVSDAGGIVLTGAKPVVITNAFEPDIVHVADATPYTVLPTDSGQIHIIPDLSADTTFNLPAEVDGQHYRFIYVGGAEDAHDWIIQSGDNLKFFVGGAVTHDPDAGGDDTAVIYSDGVNDSIMTILTPGAGTEVEMWCDGTNWFVTATVISTTDTAVVFSNI